MSQLDPELSNRFLLTSSLAFINTIGLAFFYGGLVRPKNFVSLMGQIYFIYCEITLIWIFIGYSLVYGGSKSRFLGGLDNFALRDINENPSEINSKISALLFFYSTNQAACIAPAIWTGATAERVKFLTVVLLAPLWCILVYCPIAHWNQHPYGFLHDLGIFYILLKTHVNQLAIINFIKKKKKLGIFFFFLNFKIIISLTKASIFLEVTQ